MKVPVGENATQERAAPRLSSVMLAFPAGHPAPEATPTTWTERFADSAAWRFITEFVKALIGSQVPGSELLNAANPEVARTVLILRTKEGVYERCLVKNLSSCINGDDPAFNKAGAGDYAGAFKIMYSTALPSGFPTDLPHGTYVLSATNCNMGTCETQNFVEETQLRTNADISKLANDLVSFMNWVAAGFQGSCIGGGIFASSISYTPWDGASFTATVK